MDNQCNGKQEFTRTGRQKSVCSVTYEMVASWVDEVWRSISRDIIQQPFAETGIVDYMVTKNVLHSRLRDCLNSARPNIDDDDDDSKVSDGDDELSSDDDDSHLPQNPLLGMSDLEIDLLLHVVQQ